MIIRIFKLVILVLLTLYNLSAQNEVAKTSVYLLPGQGSDQRIYKNIQLDTHLFVVHYLEWSTPLKHETMSDFALRLSTQIDTTKPFHLVGVSLGGMIATELCDLLHPEKVIVISSAKQRKELPFQYRFQRIIPIYAIVPRGLIKRASFVAQPLFERDRKIEKETCVNMLKDKDPVFLKRTVEMIIKWDRQEYNSNIIHIHGDNDHTLPIRKICYNFLINEGSHMMTLTRAEEIELLLNALLSEE